VQLANPSHARQLAGRPKTDRLDAQWIEVVKLSV
jgi:hypothetical protein